MFVNIWKKTIWRYRVKLHILWNTWTSLIATQYNRTRLYWIIWRQEMCHLQHLRLDRRPPDLHSSHVSLLMLMAVLRCSQTAFLSIWHLLPWHCVSPNIQKFNSHNKQTAYPPDSALRFEGRYWKLPQFFFQQMFKEENSKIEPVSLV